MPPDKYALAMQPFKVFSSSPRLAHGLSVVTGPVWHGSGSTGGNLAAHFQANLPRHEPQPSLSSLRRESPMDLGTGHRGNITLEDEPLSILSGSRLICRIGAFLHNRVCQARDLPSVRSASPENVLLSGILPEHTLSSSALFQRLKCSWI